MPTFKDGNTTSNEQIKASVTYNRSRDSITLRPSKPEGAEIRAAADRAGQSLQAYILEAIRQRMAQEARELDHAQGAGIDQASERDQTIIKQSSNNHQTIKY